jgi:Family of unknown function (DUF6328)
MSESDARRDWERNESEKERLDRNLEELLQGLRVAITGVQVLFAFLLVLPFQSGFPDVTDFQEKVYFGTLICVALASALLIAPSARHRLRFRQDDKAYVVFTSNWLTIAGLAFLALGMVGAILLVSDYLFGTATTVIATLVVGLALLWTWFASPLMRAVRDQRSDLTRT